MAKLGQISHSSGCCLIPYNWQSLDLRLILSVVCCRLLLFVLSHAISPLLCDAGSWCTSEQRGHSRSQCSPSPSATSFTSAERPTTSRSWAPCLRCVHPGIPAVHPAVIGCADYHQHLARQCSLWRAGPSMSVATMTWCCAGAAAPDSDVVVSHARVPAPDWARHHRVPDRCPRVHLHCQGARLPQ